MECHNTTTLIAEAQIFDAIAEVRKAIIGFVTSVCLSVRTK